MIAGIVASGKLLSGPGGDPLHGSLFTVGGHNSPYFSMYAVNGDNFTIVENHGITVDASCRVTSFSSDGTLLGIGIGGRVEIWKRSITSGFELIFTEDRGAVSIRCIEFTPDGQYVVISSYAGSTIVTKVYKRSGDAFSSIYTVPSIGAVGQYSAVWDRTGQYFYIGTANTSPFIHIFKRVGDVITKLTNPSVLPPGNVAAVDTSPIADIVYMTTNVSPFIFAYKRVGDTHTKLANPSVLPTTFCNGIAVAEDGTQVALALSSSTPYIILYRISGETLVKTASPTVLPPNSLLGVTYSPYSDHVAFVSSSGNIANLYKKAGDVLTDLPALNPVPGTSAGQYATSWGKSLLA